LTPSSTPLIPQVVPAYRGTPLRKLAPKTVFRTAHFLSRPEGDVEASYTVPVRLVVALDAFEIVVVLPVFFAGVPTPWASLACETWSDLFNEYAFSYSHTLHRIYEKCVGHAVYSLPAVLIPFMSTFFQMSKSFDSDIGVKLLGYSDHFVCYLQYSCLSIVLLSVTNFPKFKARPPRTPFLMLLKPPPSFLKMVLFNGYVPTKVCLLQHLFFTDDRQRYPGGVDVHTQPVLSYAATRKIFGKDRKKPELPRHDDAGYLPPGVEMFKETPVRTIHRHRKTDPFAAESDAENRVAPPSSAKFEESPVEPNDTTSDGLVGESATLAPRITGCLYNELGRNTVLVSECCIRSIVQLSSRPNIVDTAEGCPYNAEKILVRLVKQTFLSPARFKQIQSQTLSHTALQMLGNIQQPKKVVDPSSHNGW
jgi:hypothetical protein